MWIVKGLLLNFIIPLIIIIIAFNFNVFTGIVSILAYLAYILYRNRSAIFVMLGSASYSKGDMNTALVWMSKAYESGKAKTNVKVSYGYLLLKSGKLEQADEVLGGLMDMKLIDRDERLLVKTYYALVLWKKGYLDKAIDMLNDVMSSDFKTTTVYASLGYLLLLKGDFDKALEINQQAFDYNDTDKVIMDNLGQTYFLRGEYDMALEIYNKLIPTRPTFPEAYYNYGMVLAAKGESEKALDYMKMALRYEFTYISTVTREQIQSEIDKLSAI